MRWKTSPTCAPAMVAAKPQGLSKLHAPVPSVKVTVEVLSTCGLAEFEHRVITELKRLVDDAVGVVEFAASNIDQRRSERAAHSGAAAGLGEAVAAGHGQGRRGIDVQRAGVGKWNGGADRGAILQGQGAGNILQAGKRAVVRGCRKRRRPGRSSRPSTSFRPLAMLAIEPLAYSSSELPASDIAGREHARRRSRRDVEGRLPAAAAAQTKRSAVVERRRGNHRRRRRVVVQDAQRAAIVQRPGYGHRAAAGIAVVAVPDIHRTGVAEIAADAQRAAEGIVEPDRR